MKKFTIGVLAALFAVTSFAQNVVVEELWNHSIQEDGVAPDWINFVTERGMAYFNDKIYIPSLYQGERKVLVLDAQTGLLSATIELPKEEYQLAGNRVINSIAVTESGDLLIGNLVNDTKSVNKNDVPNGQFRVYQFALNAAGDNFLSMGHIIAWDNYGDDTYPSFTMGNYISFYGDIAPGKNGYLLTPVKDSPYVFKFDVTNGVVANDPVIIKLASSFPLPVEGEDVNLGNAPFASPINNELFIASGQDLMPAVYNMEGELISTMTGTYAVQDANGSGTEYFQFKGRDFLIANSTNWEQEDGPKNAFQLFEVPNIDLSAADSITMLPEDGLGFLEQNNYTNIYPIAVDVKSDHVLIYVYDPASGIAAYKMTIDSGTSISENKTDAIEFYPNPATDLINFTREMASIKIYDMSGKFVREFNSVTQINVSDLRGFYLIHATERSGNDAIKKLLILK